MDEVWESQADWWQARFTRGVDAEYTQQILPLLAEQLAGAGVVVDVGCGEGQVSRPAAAAGALVVGVDGSAAQLAEAVRRGGGVRYVRGFATGVPLREAAADAVVLCLVVEHVGDLGALVDEVARVLRPGGTALVVMNHPLLHSPDSCWVDDWGPDGEAECYWRVGPYLPDDRSLEEVAPGVHLVFVHRPLHRYVNTMTAHGLLLEHLDEPHLAWCLESLVAGDVVNRIVVDPATTEWSRVALERMLAIA